MKKILMLTLALCLCCCAVFAEETAVETLGVWELTAAMDAEGNPLEAGVTMILAAFSDGTFTIESDMEPVAGTWTLNETEDGLILDMGDGTTQEMLVDPSTGYLYTETEGIILILTPYVELPDIVAAASLEDFQGTWLINGVIMGGTYYDLSGESEDSMVMLFGSATPSIVIAGDQVDVREGRQTGTAAFEEGGLVVTDGETTFFVSLLEDGRITVATGDELITDYFAVKAE